MKAPDWRQFALNDGVLREPTLDANSIVLWLPAERNGEYLHWERVSNVPRAAVSVEQGLCATPAASVLARQRVRGFFSKLFGRTRESPDNRSWVLPSGEAAEQCGERRTDCLLVWAEDETTALDEPRIKSRWPDSKGCQKIGKNLFLVTGIESTRESTELGPLPPQGNPRDVAEQLLASARQAGDRGREISALTDRGIIAFREGKAQDSVRLLEEALAITRQLGDRARERDVLGNLGLSILAAGQPQRALELLNQELTYAREAGDRFAEKGALDRLGLAYSVLRQHVHALAFYEQALALARETGDRHHQADLLWYVAIQHAELNQRDQAIQHGQAAVDLMRARGQPQATLLSEHLQKYRLGDSGTWPAGTPEAGAALSPGSLLGGSMVTTVWASQPTASTMQGRSATGPGLLRMALSAAQSMVKFLGAGMNTVPAETQQKRLRTCASCEHHTGLRCKLCGCFTGVKTWMPHEECPIGKWTSTIGSQKS